MSENYTAKRALKQIRVFAAGMGLAITPRMKLILTLLLLAVPALAAPVKGELFMSTPPVNTSQGPAHMEVQAFEINNAADLQRAQAEIAAKTGATPTTELFHLEVTAKDYQRGSVESLTRESLASIEADIDTQNRLDPKPVQVEPPKGFFKRHYNVTLALVRFMSNTAVVSTGLIMGKGVSLEHAVLIGALAGSMSAAVQLKSDAVFKWLSNSVLMVNAAKKLGVLPVTDAPGVTERALKQVEMYSRWAMLETGFLLAVQSAMGLLNIPIAENLLFTVGKSTMSQGVFEIGVLKASEHLAGINPRWAAKSALFKNISMFAGSGISVLAAIGSMVDMPFANLGFATLTASGLVLTFSSKITKLKSVEQILTRWKFSKPRCGYLLLMVN